MKNLFITMCTAVLTISAQAQTRVILNPDYDKPEGVPHLEPKRVELTDTATVVHISVNSNFSWYALGEVWLKADGKKYALRGGRRISTFGQGKAAYEKDETIPFRNSKGDTVQISHVPKEEPFVEWKRYEHTSVADSLVLSFEPLPTEATAFDFSNDILNISLTKTLQLNSTQNILPMPDVTPEKCFEAIAAMFPGKVVFIDLWTTWCGPCKWGIGKMTPIKKELEGKDVVFVYLTNETSDKVLWKRSVASTKGYHLMLPGDYWNQLPCIVEFSGIPQYFLYDRSGKRVLHQVGFADGSEQHFKEEILKALEEEKRVVLRPAFKSSSTGSLCPKRVELTKEATVVHFRMNCAHWRNWSMEGARLESDGKRYAFRQGRIITHDGTEVLTDDPFQLGKQYAQNAQQDSVILYFEPLAAEAKTFDFIEEGEDEGLWRVWGVRLDGQLYPSIFPPYESRVDDGKPLAPLTLKHGEARATFVVHGGSISYFGDPSRDPITGQYESKSEQSDSTLVYCHPAYVTTCPHFLGCRVDGSMFTDQFGLNMVPDGEFTLEVDATSCTARDNDFAAGKPKNRDCYRVSGPMGDLVQVMLENALLGFSHPKETPAYTGQTFAEWRDALWQNFDTLRRAATERLGYTRRQQEFLRLLVEDRYVRTLQDYRGCIAAKMHLQHPDSVLAPLAATFTLADPHAKELMLFRDSRTFYLPPCPEQLAYIEANGLDHGEVYKMLKGFASAKKTGEKIRQGHVQPDNVIQATHPYFQPVLRAFNDSTRVLMERLRAEAQNRMMTTPDVPGDQLLATIAALHPGKVVFFDLWTTWCGPCLKGIQAMESLKEELKGKDIVFVYLTDESSPLNQWNKYVLDIPGLHYRLTTAQWRQLPWPSGGGIPQYFLYDRKGHCVWEQTGFSDSVLERIRQEILKALEPNN